MMRAAKASATTASRKLREVESREPFSRARAMQSPITKYNKDYYGGGLMLLLGLGAMFQGSQYPIGSLSRMGPGFFPVALGAILALTGVAIAARAKASVPEGEETVLPPEWRGWIC